MIRSDLARKLKLDLESAEDKYLRAANQELMPVLGEVKVPVHLEGEIVLIKAWVVDKLSKPLLVGKDSLQELSTCIELSPTGTEVKMMGSEG